MRNEMQGLEHALKTAAVSAAELDVTEMQAVEFFRRHYQRHLSKRNRLWWIHGGKAHALSP